MELTESLPPMLGGLEVANLSQFITVFLEEGGGVKPFYYNMTIIQGLEIEGIVWLFPTKLSFF